MRPLQPQKSSLQDLYLCLRRFSLWSDSHPEITMRIFFDWSIDKKRVAVGGRGHMAEHDRKV